MTGHLTMNRIILFGRSRVGLGTTPSPMLHVASQAARRYSVMVKPPAQQGRRQATRTRTVSIATSATIHLSSSSRETRLLDRKGQKELGGGGGGVRRGEGEERWYFGKKTQSAKATSWPLVIPHHTFSLMSSDAKSIFIY